MSRYYQRRCSKEGKTIRFTVCLEQKIESKIKELHESLVPYMKEGWSMSKVINMLLLSGLLANEKLGIQDWHTIERFVNGTSPNIEQVDVKEFLRNLAAIKQTV